MRIGPGSNHFMPAFSGGMEIFMKSDLSQDVTFSRKAVILTKGILWGYVFSLILIFAAALIFTYTPVSESYLGGTVSVITVLSIAFSAALVSSKNKTRGYLHGMITGIIYMSILYVISISFFNDLGSQKSIISMLITGIICGALGGIAGVNLSRGK